MSNKTQLPVEVVAAKWNPDDKERQATTYAGIVVAFLGSVIQKLSTGCNYETIEFELRSSIYHYDKLTEIILPGEYATKLHQANETIKVLEQWKSEAMTLLAKIDQYADKHPEIRLGMSKVDFTVDRAKGYDKLKELATGWRPLLEEVLKLDDFEVAHVPEKLIDKIKTFLYGE